MEKAYGYKLIAAARAYRDVRKKSPIGDSLVSAAQALAVSPLAKKDARRAAKLLEGLAAEHGGVLPSARSIEAAVYREPGMGLVPKGDASQVEGTETPETLPVPPNVPVATLAKVASGLGKTLEKYPDARAERYAAGGGNSVRREEDAKARALKKASAPPVATSRAGEDVFVHHGDFGGFPIEPGSARLVFADPPYNKPWTEEHAPRLAAFARDALEDGGFFVCYTGDPYALDLANTAKDAGLGYYGFIFVKHRHGKETLHHPRKTLPGKLVWVFVKGTAKLSSPYRGMADCGDPHLKEDHEWQQALGEAEQIIEDFTSPGDLVVDPCLGSGTAAVAWQRRAGEVLPRRRQGLGHIR